MHHFIYSLKDTYITNESAFLKKNVGIDELVEIKSNTQLQRKVVLYLTASVSESISITSNFLHFTGNVDGYLSGSVDDSDLIVSGPSDISGSFLFTGDVTGSVNSVNVTSSVVDETGHIIGDISGHLTGSWVGIVCDASGSVVNFTGIGQGILIGSQSVYSPYNKFTVVPELSRALLQFDVSSISQSISDGSIENTGSLKCILKLTVSDINEVPLKYSIYGYPISQSWEMGNGRYETGGSSLGVNWQYKNYDGISGSTWFNVTGSGEYSGDDYLNTASFASESFKNGGGTWYYSIPDSYITESVGYCSDLLPTGSLKAIQNFNYETSDLSMDITDIVKSWICGCVPNEGILLMSSLELSQVENSTGALKFFSKDTNTIYSPYIDVNWDDSVYLTGSLIPVSETVPYTVILKNINKEYKFGSVPRVNVFVREKNPLKNFVRGYQMNQYLTSSLLPPTSYYAIKDNESERMILGFDDATKLNCDGILHYFTLDTTSFATERYYRILIKVVTDTESVIFDDGYIFKITR